jgi:hypothetical protein
MSTSPILKILFFINDFRDRDLWPFANVLSEKSGIQVYYLTTSQLSAEGVPKLCEQNHFDMVITADRVLKSEKTDRYFRSLPHQPIILEVIFNNTDEVLENYGFEKINERLESENAYLLLLDSLFQNKIASLGISRTKLLSFGVYDRHIYHLHYFKLNRKAKRYFGWLNEDSRTGTNSLLAFASQLKRGFYLRPKSIPILFLGECKPGIETHRIEEIQKLYFSNISAKNVLSASANFEADSNQQIEASAQKIKSLLDSKLQSLEPSQIGHSVLSDYLLTNFRKFRRLHYVRRIKENFGKRFLLIGDDFLKLGLPAEPSNHQMTEALYLRSKVAVDFGSACYDSSIYSRSSRIISSNSCLIQLEQFDAKQVFKEAHDSTVFNSSESMLTRIEKTLESQKDRNELMRQQFDISKGANGWQASVDLFLGQF